MKPTIRDSLLSWTAVLALAAVLCLLAVLQYRWIGGVSESTRARMQANLQSSMMQFRRDLSDELGRICLEMQPESGSGRQIDGKRYARQLHSWEERASHPSLVKNVYLWDAAKPAPSRMLRLNAAAGKFEVVAETVAEDDRRAPSDLTLPDGELRSRLQALSSNIEALTHHRSFGFHFGPPREFAHPGESAFHRSLNSVIPWAIDENIPALIYPVMPLPNPQGREPEMPASWVVIELNSQVLQEHILPELAERHFGGSSGASNEMSYEVAVLSGDAEHPKVLFSSDPGFGQKQSLSADATLNLWGPLGAPGTPFRVFVPHGESRSAPRGSFNVFAPLPGPSHNLGPISRSPDGNDFGVEGPFRFVPVHLDSTERDWQLFAEHRKGSVEAAVTDLRRRSLAISFSVLLILAATMSLIIVTSQRARTLAQLQMDFVAGVSHDLRTPIAVISSAAENIVDGVVVNQEQLARYGLVIKGQAKQLMQLVEQVLLFASTRQSRPRYNLHPLNIAEVIEAALESTSGALNSGGITLERQIDTNLPPVVGDFGALSQCLQNLITNAIKYGGDARWIGIRASLTEERAGLRWVAVAIEDRGIGIAPEDRKRIFEPFYRSRLATEMQIHGTGLGLTLARSMVEGMGGALGVESTLEKGSRFTLLLPIAGSMRQDRVTTGAIIAPAP